MMKNNAIILITFYLLSGFGNIKTVNFKQSRFIITDYGALAGNLINTGIIQTVIDKCAATGGGVVVIPQGTFLTGAIFLKQGVNLQIDGILKGTSRQTDYPMVKTRWEGLECQWTSALINATDITGIEITGTGTIDGSGTDWPLIIRKSSQQWDQLSPITRDSIMKSQRIGRPRLICFQHCKKVHIANVKLLNQAVWCLHILYSCGVTVENLKIRANHTILSSDGIDIDSSTDVLVSDCDIDVNDDCISIKSGKDEEGLRINKPSENIIIEKCHFGFGHGGVAIGSETSGGIRHVEVRNCIADSGNLAPIRFKTQPSRGNIVEDIVYRDIKIKDVKQVFEFNMEWRMVPPIPPPSKILPKIRNITFINISGYAKSIGYIFGLKDSPIENVGFINCNLTAQKGLVIENIRNFDFSGLNLKVTDGKPIIQNEMNRTIQNN